MVPCAAIGDSIAVGVGQARPECVTTARVGITSGAYINSLLPIADTGSETTIISLGVNDDDTVDTLSNLRTVRRQVSSRVVYWLLPGLKEQVRSYIQTVAAEHGDRLIDTRPYVGRDHLHPNGAGYQQIAAMSYGEGGSAVYAAAPPPPVEVAEAPAHFRLAGEPAFRINYGQLSAQHVAHAPERDMFYFSAPHRLSRLATPRERIRNLRETARAESRPPAWGAWPRHPVPDRAAARAAARSCGTGRASRRFLRSPGNAGRIARRTVRAAWQRRPQPGDRAGTRRIEPPGADGPGVQRGWKAVRHDPVGA